MKTRAIASEQQSRRSNKRGARFAQVITGKTGTRDKNSETVSATMKHRMLQSNVFDGGIDEGTNVRKKRTSRLLNRGSQFATTRRRAAAPRDVGAESTTRGN